MGFLISLSIDQETPMIIPAPPYNYLSNLRMFLVSLRVFTQNKTLTDFTQKGVGVIQGSKPLFRGVSLYFYWPEMREFVKQ